LHSVRISLGRPLDFSGLYHLAHLQDLWLQNGLFPPDRLPLLDLSRLPKLRHLSAPFFHKLRGLATLAHLTDLHLDHIYGLKELDFTAHPNLEVLDIGPANGVNTVHLDGLAALRSLTFACMRNLTTITGAEFYDTVTELDIRSSPRIPAAILSRFRQLKNVTIGMKSTVTPRHFPLCSPRISHFPV
jgi:hypothetical protein